MTSNTFKIKDINFLPVRAVARTLIWGGGGCIFIYSGSARLVSFEIKLISKEISRAEPEYMNIHPLPISVLATALLPVVTYPMIDTNIQEAGIINDQLQTKRGIFSIKNNTKNLLTVLKHIESALSNERSKAHLHYRFFMVRYG